MAYIYDLADVWASSGTTFTGIKMNVTDTASAAGSLLMDLQVGGVSKVSVRKDGRVFGNSYYFDSINGAILGASNQVMIALEGAGAFHSFKTGHFMMSSIVKLGWSSDAALSTTGLSALDLTLFRDAANTLAQRNGVNAQAFNLYNTYTDASNYERGALRYDSNVLGLHSQALGTGTVRNIQIGGTASGINTHMLVGVASRLVRFNHSGTTYFEVNTNSGEIKLALDRTLSQLSATPAVGMIARVTDATSPTVGSTVTGGGAAAALCWYNGTNWTVIGV